MAKRASTKSKTTKSQKAKSKTATKAAKKASPKKKTAKKKAKASKKAAPAKKKVAAKKKKKKVAEKEVTIDRRRDERRDEEKPETQAEAAKKLTPRKKVNRRRQIDPTTCERDYSDQEVEFMNALDEYKRENGRMFPTCSEVLEVIRGLGYTQLSKTELAAQQVHQTPEAGEVENAFDPNAESESDEELELVGAGADFVSF